MSNLERINEKAEDVLIEEGLFSVPVDIEKLAEAYGIKYSYSDPGDDGLSGMLLRKKEETRILINETHSDNRKRFSFAHELGHYFLHEGEELFVDGKTGVLLRAAKGVGINNNKEREANQFAAALLMPIHLIEKKIEEYKELSCDSLLHVMSHDFGVSQEAMSYRLLNLGYML